MWSLIYTPIVILNTRIMEQEISDRYPVYFDLKYFRHVNISSFRYFILIDQSKRE